MKTEYTIRGFKADDRLRQKLESDLQNLNRLLPVERADVVLERQRDTSPAFQAVALLVVPGPDIHAGARDHTWLAAWEKAASRLQEQIQKRLDQQNEQKKSRSPVRLSDNSRGKPAVRG